MSNPRPTWARWVTRVSLIFAIGAFVYMIWSAGRDGLDKYFARIGWFWILVVLMEVVGTWLDAVAIKAFMSPEHQAVNLRQTTLSQLAGRAVNIVTPGHNLGEVVKMSVLTEYVSESRAIATILLYNIVGFAIELAVVVVATPVLLIFVPMPTGMVWATALSGGICLVLLVGMLLLVRQGMLASLIRVPVKLRLISKERHAKWDAKLRGIDDKMRLVGGARRRDRWLGIWAMIASRFLSMGLSLMIVHVVSPGALTVGFISAYVVGGFVIYMVGSLIPMGIGVSEGGWYGLCVAMGQNGAVGVTLVLARRTTQLVYAAIGLVLLTANETVKRARVRLKETKAREAQQAQEALMPVANVEVTRS